MAKRKCTSWKQTRAGKRCASFGAAPHPAESVDMLLNLLSGRGKWRSEERPDTGRHAAAKALARELKSSLRAGQLPEDAWAEMREEVDTLDDFVREFKELLNRRGDM